MSSSLPHFGKQYILNIINTRNPMSTPMAYYYSSTVDVHGQEAM